MIDDKNDSARHKGKTNIVSNHELAHQHVETSKMLK
jgi:hypothetical protein